MRAPSITCGLGLDGQYMNQYSSGVLASLDVVDIDRHLSIVNADLLSKSAIEGIGRTFSRVVHHLSNVSSTGISGPDLERLRQLNYMSSVLSAEWCCEDAGIWNFGEFNLPYFVPPPLTPQGLQATIEGVRKIQAVSSCPFALEVPSFSFVYGEIPLEYFFMEICDRTGVALVLDTGHLFSYCLATSRSVDKVWDGFPKTHIRELHVAGARIDPTRPKRYIDTHSHRVLPEVWDILKLAILQSKNLCAVTFEVGTNLSDEDFIADHMIVKKVVRDFNDKNLKAT
jgi:uncharacterized protein